jgi:antitoxin HigA-1
MLESLTIIEGVLIMARTPIHPGEILADELREIGLTAAGLARILDVPANRISQIVIGKRAITADTALRLARYFGTSPDLWMNLQKTYELDLARKEVDNGLKQIQQRPRRSPSFVIERGH